MSVIQRWIFNSLLLIALAAFIQGVFAPLMRLEKLWVFNNQYSLYLSLETLYSHGEIFLFVFLLLFSVITPLIKVLGLALVANAGAPLSKRHRGFLYLLETWGKWSMLDVFVVALLFVSVKLGTLANVTVHAGLYWFGGAVILIQLLSMWLGWKVEKNPPQHGK